ncbi:protein hinderin isoform X2 [Echeneis naucrates]|uniref:protein hinderin isoform X2 n=1 Tax=Echeneis naucrates TaxID=173247 RepID=UPI001113865E|nr:protein hinderin isoform X2 [Echeneis naucrates]
MAAEASKSGCSGIFWMQNVSDEEQPLVFVPGVDGELKMPCGLRSGRGSTLSKRGNNMSGAARRRSDLRNELTLKKGGKKQDHLQSDHAAAHAKETVPAHHSAAATQHTPSLASDSLLPLPQVISETSRDRSQVCLKDLCPEDKRRIANLIEELARVSEEKEESVQRLKDEHEHFERKILQLEQQNLIIAQERESILSELLNKQRRSSLQQQYRECQELLGLYQQYLSEQQAKLNKSIAQLIQAPAHSKVLSCEEAHSRANVSPFDGSYLSFATTQAQQPQVHRSGNGGRGAVQTLKNPGKPSGGPVKEHRNHKRESCHRCDHYQGSCRDSGYETQQWRRDNSSHVENGQHETVKQHECERVRSGVDTGLETKGALTRTLLGHEDWEEKRHQLLLQKMQLEMERERLQARLDEQEERLNRQKQQLHQSCLESSRFPRVTQAEVCSSTTRNGNLQLDSPPHQELPSSGCGNTEVNPAEQVLNEKHPQPVAAHLGNGMETPGFDQSRRDMATSPAKSQMSLSKPHSVSVIPESADARLDFSVAELLDIFSPVSEYNIPSMRRSKQIQPRPDCTTPKSMGRTLLAPGKPYSQSTQQDLEESQILEDIFFIL